MKVKTIDILKNKGTDFDIKDDIFDIDPRVDIISRVVRWQLTKKDQVIIKLNLEVKSGPQMQKYIDKRELEGQDTVRHRSFNLEVVE